MQLENTACLEFLGRDSALEQVFSHIKRQYSLRDRKDLVDKRRLRYFCLTAGAPGTGKSRLLDAVAGLDEAVLLPRSLSRILTTPKERRNLGDERKEDAARGAVSEWLP
eukprot:m51a1_g13665 hypothetical protein (109) ;mRNA; f:143-469